MVGAEACILDAVSNRSVPVSTVLPHLVLPRRDRCPAWLTKVFGFQEHFRYGQPSADADVPGRAVIMLTGSTPGTQVPPLLGHGTQTLTVMSERRRRSLRENQAAKGAIFGKSCTKTVYERGQYGVEDLDGHRWIFSAHARDLSPEEWEPRSSIRCRGDARRF